MNYNELYKKAMKWMHEQDGYYVSYEVFTEKFDKLRWKETSGITMLIDDETGDSLIPKRDVRNLVKTPEEVDKEWVDAS